MKKCDKAFTVVELVAVIVVLAIILAITVPSITGAIRNSTMRAVESDAKLVLDAVRLKKIEDDTFDPTNLTESNVSSLLGLSSENYSNLEVKINEGQTYIKITGQGKWSGFSVCGTFFDMQVNEGDCYLDFNDPVITLLGDSFVNISVGESYSDAGATANDVEDGDITDRIVVTGTVNPSVPGTYNIIYNVSDTAGREAVSVTRTVYVIDVEAPVITILGDNPSNINVGDTYSDAGATALDDADGDVTNRIVTTGTVNSNAVGTYSVTYTVSDNAGHEATAVRTVNVIDNVLPTVIFSMNGNATWAKTRSTTVTVSDAHTGVNTSSLKYLWNTSTTTPSEASFTTAFANGGTLNSPAGVTGAYYLWILAKDNAGNTSIVRTNVFNLDNTVPPVPTSQVRYGSSSGTVRANNDSSWTNQTLWWGNFSATDPASGINRYEFSSECTGTITGTLGTSYTYSNNSYDICIRAVDNAGNASAWGSVTYIRADNTAPNIPTSQVRYGGSTGTIRPNGTTTWSTQTLWWGNFSATDATSGISSYQYSTGCTGTSSGNLGGSYSYPNNNYTFCIRATDNAGNISAWSSATYIRADTTAPIITMNGSNPVTIIQGSTYSDAGAVYTDNISGIAGAGVYASNVNPSIVGSYYVTYYATDGAGNSATQVTRTVNVVAPPIYTFTTAGATGATGPTQDQINTAYAGTSLAGMVSSSNGTQYWTVPTTGNYRIETRGAQGTANGAVMIGTFSLTAGQQLKIIVGQIAGGGTFVTYADNTPLIIAGGGGSAGYGTCGTGAQGQIGTSGGAGTGSYACAGGTNGNGGPSCPNGTGGAGGGLLSDGGSTTCYNNGVNPTVIITVGGAAFVNGGSNAQPWQQYYVYMTGGFGGGGGGCSHWQAGASGGGYSGGGGSGWQSCGGGGGSYNAGTNQANTAGANSGEGRAIITFTP